MRRRGLRGAIASRSRKTLNPDDLGKLTDHADAKRWLETIGRAVASGALSDRAAQAATRAVAEWIKAEESRLTREVVEQLRRRVEELEEGSKRQAVRVQR
jgi:hypothetical protein